MLNGGTLNYFAVPWGILNNPLPLVLVAGIEVGLMGAVERYRQSGTGPGGYSPGVGKFDSSIFSGLDNLYPGAPRFLLGFRAGSGAFPIVGNCFKRPGQCVTWYTYVALATLHAMAVYLYGTLPVLEIEHILEVKSATDCASRRHSLTRQVGRMP